MVTTGENSKPRLGKRTKHSKGEYLFHLVNSSWNSLDRRIICILRRSSGSSVFREIGNGLASIRNCFVCPDSNDAQVKEHISSGTRRNRQGKTPIAVVSCDVLSDHRSRVQLGLRFSVVLSTTRSFFCSSHRDAGSDFGVVRHHRHCCSLAH